MQISVAHACERPAEIFVKMHKSPRASPGEVLLWVADCLRCRLAANRTQGATILLLGWGSIGSTPLKEPLRTGAGKCYLVFDPILVEDKLSLGIGYLKLSDT